MQKRIAHSASPSPISWLRTLAACATTVIAFGIVGAVDSPIGSGPSSAEEYALLGFAATALLMPFLARIPHLLAQIFARGILMQLSFFGALVTVQNLFVRSNFDHSVVGLALVASGLAPILILGRSGLSSRSERFQPIAFRKTMFASLLFGMADLWALLLYAAIEGSLMYCVGGAMLMGVAIFGLYRMKVWGLVVCLLANLFIAGAALSGQMGLPDVLVGGLAVTAGIQLLLPIPISHAILRTRRHVRA